MDPNYTSDRPGKSPMGMDLVPVYEDEGLADGQVRVSPSFLQNFAVRTADVQRGSLPVFIRTVGILAHNEERVVSVQTKYAGWIEEASVNNVGETVQRGDVLFEIYSPELVTTQREFTGAMDYLRRLRDGGAYAEAIERAQSLLEATRERLLYWDMTEAQIDALAESGTVARTVRVFSPATGFIVEKMGNSMEGLRIEPGMTVLKIADHSTLWAETEFYEDDLRHVGEGEAVGIEADAFPGRRWDGRILFFRPAVNTQTRTLTAFVEVANADLRLRPGMYVDVTARGGGASDAVIVAAEAVLHSGTRAVVIVARGGGVFEPREVLLGTESEGNAGGDVRAGPGRADSGFVPVPHRRRRQPQGRDLAAVERRGVRGAARYGRDDAGRRDAWLASGDAGLGWRDAWLARAPAGRGWSDARGGPRYPSLALREERSCSRASSTAPSGTGP